MKHKGAPETIFGQSQGLSAPSHVQQPVIIRQSSTFWPAPFTDRPPLMKCVAFVHHELNVLIVVLLAVPWWYIVKREKEILQLNKGKLSLKAVLAQLVTTNY